MSTYLARRAQSAAPQDSLRYLYSFWNFRPEPLVERTLKNIDDGIVPQESVGPLLSQLLSSRHGQLPAWRYLKKSWKNLAGQVGDMGLSRVVESVGALPAEHRADIVAFFEANPPTGAERALARALENLDQRAELHARITPGLLAFVRAL